ncbi:Energy-dependent translational throttle protein EttA [Emticicia aquatica]|uniref:Energy-dependent translational throttle protein EttA n=1 Tax=Emticicia aquatica TaxID=1681835 RepID=A0ABN8ERU2_9BACT|nr:ABC-F family ATP-binding cassette domain-containing protein [Emticicia aquatica]CAH0995626.1 Energy-dependent translational throttle protein EttA [Emticicia aquatica]
MNYLSAENIGRNLGERWLFKNLTFGILQGEKVALIGANGAGKSSMLDMITGNADIDGGEISIRKDIRYGYLGQNPDLNPAKTVIETIFSSENSNTLAIKEYDLALESGDGNRIANAMEQVDNLKAWDYEAKVKQILAKLGIEDFEKLIENLSGGQKKRVALAQVLIEEPDFLILDEPTNHLDLDTIEWLEGYLSSSNITLLLVTHDRYFLDKACNRILELADGKVFKYLGNYAYYLEKKEEQDAVDAATQKNYRNLLRKELEWMRRQPKARGTKSQSRIDAFYDLKEKTVKKGPDEKLELSMKMERMGSKIIEIQHISKSFDNKKIIAEFNYTFKRGDRIGIVGKNGMGKSTMLEIITEKIKPDIGRVVKGDTIKIGYYSQGGLDFDESQRVIEVVRDIAEYVKMADGTELSISNFLTLFLFPPAMQYSFVSKLSGGEKRRLQLLKILVQNPNFLILDEPTNDLDIATLNVLEDFLLNFGGCLLVVSHDRYFMDKLVDHLFVFEGDGYIRDFPGNYTDYRSWKEDKEEQEQLAMNAKPSSNAKNVIEIPIATPQMVETKRKLTFKEQKEYEGIGAEVENLEKKKAILVEKMNSGDGSHEELAAWAKEFENVSELISEKELRWLELSELI